MVDRGATHPGLTKLSDADAVSLCRLAERTYKGALGAEDAYCTAEGALGATSTADCEQWKQKCLTDGTYNDDLREDWGCANQTAADVADPEDAQCTATVAELEACYRAQGRALSRYTEMVACSNPATFDGGFPPAECISLHCPSWDDWDN